MADRRKKTDQKGLPDRLEYLMRIGLVDRSKLQQYKLAFKNPEANVRFAHYRTKILEVFYKVFDIVAENDPIFIKVRQEVIRRYRNQKPMKKKSLKEAAPKKPTREQRARQSQIADFRKKVASLELNKPDEVHKIHNELAKGKPDGMHHRVWIAQRAIAAGARTRLQKAKAAETQKTIDMIKDATSKLEPLDHSKLPILGPDKFPSKPKPKPPTKQEEIQKAYHVASQNAHYDIKQGLTKLPRGKSLEDHKHEVGMNAANAVARKHADLERVAKEGPDPIQKKKGIASKLLGFLSKKKVNEGLSMSGGRVHQQVTKNASSEVNNDRRELQRDKAEAARKQNQQDRNRSSAISAMNMQNKNSRGQPKT